MPPSAEELPKVLPQEEVECLPGCGGMLYHLLTGEVKRGTFDLPSSRTGAGPRFDVSRTMQLVRQAAPTAPRFHKLRTPKTLHSPRTRLRRDKLGQLRSRVFRQVL